MKAPAARRAQPTLPQIKERKSRRNSRPARAPAPLPIRFYCREPLARASREMVQADSARTDWSPEIPPVKAGQVDRAPAEDAAGREEHKAALADPAAGSAELRAECLEAEALAPEVAAVAGADD